MAVMLVAATAAAFAGTEYYDYGDSGMPDRFVSCELLAVGGRSDFLYAYYRAIGADVSLGNLRLGTALVEGFNLAAYAVPLHVGWNLLRRPRRTAFFYGMLPEAYADGAIYLFGISPTGDYHSATFRLAVCGGVDYYGVGARLSLGVLTWGSGITPVIDLQARILTGSFGL
jgi:hypothetical protein